MLLKDLWLMHLACDSMLQFLVGVFKPGSWWSRAAEQEGTEQKASRDPLKGSDKECGRMLALDSPGRCSSHSMC